MGHDADGGDEMSEIIPIHLRTKFELVDEILDTRKQRDELLAACKAALKAHRRMEFLTCPRVCWCWILEDAIANVEGNDE